MPISRVLEMGMTKTRGCPYHCDIGILEIGENWVELTFVKTSGTVTWAREKDLPIENLSKGAFERHTSTGGGLFTFPSGSLGPHFQLTPLYKYKETK